MCKTFVLLFIACILLSSCEKKKVIALTFDDGPNSTTTVHVLDVLKEHDVVASFFVIGKYVNDSTKQIMVRAHEMGCEYANHSKNHFAMDTLSADSIKSEIEYTNNKIYEAIGEKPHFFRPPYIAINDLMFQTIDLPFICGYGADDWVPNVSAKERAKRILDKVGDGDIILLHDFEGNEQTVEALKIIIPSLLKEGYEFVTISQLFKEKGVEPQHNIIYSFATQKEKRVQ